MRVIDEEQLDFDDVMIMPRRSSLGSRFDVDIVRKFVYNKKDERVFQTIWGIPVVAANMGTIATPRMAKIFAKNGFFCAMEKHLTVSELKQLFLDLEQMAHNAGVNSVEYLNKVFPSIGVREPLDLMVDLKEELYSYVNGINIDVPNGYCPQLVKRVQEVRELFPTAFIIAGTVVTPDICQDLINAGADETASDTITVEGKTYKQFYGMSSKLAQERHFGGMANYRASEGREKWIPATGPLQNTIDDICGGLRSCGTYIGARKIKNFPRQAAFYKVHRQLNKRFANCKNI